MGNLKPRIVIVGGFGRQIPQELHRQVNVVRHIELDTERISAVPACDAIVLLTGRLTHKLEDLKQTALRYKREGTL